MWSTRRLYWELHWILFVRLCAEGMICSVHSQLARFRPVRSCERSADASSLSARRRGRAPDRADAGGPEAPRRLVRGCARLI